MDKRGPKIGDAASLWNFTPSPGWTKEESLILKLCLLKYGVGQWIQIQATGLLPGKLIQQLNGATQRLLGQQSLAAFSGLRVDIDRVRADNEAKVDAHRKNGLVIWTGSNPTKEMKSQWQQEAKDKYCLTPEQQQEAEAAFEELAAAQAATAAAAAAATFEVLPPGLNILDCDAQQLSTHQKQLLLCALHQRLKQLVTAAVQHHPTLAPLVTYQQQQQQTGWIAQGVPGLAGGGGAAAAGGGGGSSSGVADGLDGSGSDINQANMVVRQAGTAAGRAHKPASRLSRPSGSKNSSGTSKKRGRSNAAAADDIDEQQQQRKRGSGSSSRGKGQGSKGNGKQDGTAGGGLLEEMMQAALDAGVAQLMDMGYSRKKAVDALQECHCDVELAVEYLATACC